MVSAVLLVDVYETNNFDSSFQAVEDILEVVKNLEVELEEPKPKKKIKGDKDDKGKSNSDKINTYEILTDSLIS